MPITTRAEPIDRDIELLISEFFSPAARSAAIAAFARGQLADAEQVNESVLGHVPAHTTTVDGSEGASEDSVRPDGVIVYQFELITDLCVWIMDQLRAHAPEKSGKFRDSFAFFADGDEVDIGDEVPSAAEYVFLNSASITFAYRAPVGNVQSTHRGGARGDVRMRTDHRTPAIIVKVR
jgi:hypothetical protein